MNRWDEIRATARDIATNVHSDPDKIKAMADDLIKLCGLMVGEVGKGVAIDGEIAMNENGDGDPADSARYLVGEDIQRAAQTAIDDATGVDLERWTRPDPNGYVLPGDHGWTYVDRRPDVARSDCDESETCPEHGRGHVVTSPVPMPECCRVNHVDAITWTTPDAPVPECCRPGGPDDQHTCMSGTGPCCYSNNEVCRYPG